MSDNVCGFNKSGYCKFKETCRKRHINKICKVTNCVNRHPKESKYLSTYKYCKLGDNCAFEHKIKQENKVLENSLKEIMTLKNEMLDLKNQ